MYVILRFPIFALIHPKHFQNEWMINSTIILDYLCQQLRGVELFSKINSKGLGHI